MRSLNLENPNFESQDPEEAELKKRAPDEVTKRIDKLDLDELLPELLS